MTRASEKWRSIGLKLGYTEAELNEIKCNESENDELCWFHIMEKWLYAEQPSPSYPASWQGLYKLLKDSKVVDSTLNLLRRAVINAIPHPSTKHEQKSINEPSKLVFLVRFSSSLWIL